jgi:hypothetical protein
MRQIEAYRLNPSVGLVPPPSRLWRFVTSNQLLLVALVPLAATAAMVVVGVPVTLSNVVVIAANLAMAAALILLYLIQSLLRLLAKVVDAHTRLAGVTDRLADVIAPTAGDASPKR